MVSIGECVPKAGKTRLAHDKRDPDLGEVTQQLLDNDNGGELEEKVVHAGRVVARADVHAGHIRIVEFVR